MALDRYVISAAAVFCAFILEVLIGEKFLRRLVRKIQSINVKKVENEQIRCKDCGTTHVLIFKFPSGVPEYSYLVCECGSLLTPSKGLTFEDQERLLDIKRKVEQRGNTKESFQKGSFSEEDIYRYVNELDPDQTRCLQLV